MDGKEPFKDPVGKQDKNRYVEVLPFDFNRVLLHRDSTDHEDWGYINASLVSSKTEDCPEWHYIVTQVLHFLNSFSW